MLLEKNLKVSRNFDIPTDLCAQNQCPHIDIYVSSKFPTELKKFFFIPGEFWKSTGSVRQGYYYVFLYFLSWTHFLNVCWR